MTEILTIQFGKRGLTETFIESLAKTFKNHDLVKVSVLKGAFRDRKELENLGKTLCSELKKKFGKDFTFKSIGYILVIKKWRKSLQIQEK